MQTDGKLIGPSSYSFFQITEAFELGASLYSEINNNMLGRLATTMLTCGVLAQMVSRRPGSHVEIGSLFGGSAILAALVKKHYGHDGMVYAIDPITENGYYGSVDWDAGLWPTADMFRSNLERFGVEDRVELIDAYSDPFPPTLGGFDTAFIDGDHTLPVALYDWMEVSKRTFDYVMFDNTDRKIQHNGVMIARDIALANPNWEIVCMFDICTVFHRRGRDY